MKLTQRSLSSDDRIRGHCNKTVDIYEDVSSPELTRQNRYGPLTCSYRFKVNKPALKDDWVIVVRFKSFKVGRVLNATHCENGYIKVSARACVTCRVKQGKVWLTPAVLGHIFTLCFVCH
ncbi:hypothetical protein E2C01_061289 [Portunus trituberculatus]|uniref:CUB domain-containing protein n=1 Tax=Portunus trituberculatus TaxID=210409 RepID=A0A5B7HAB5_PORTR|nr:hypothetical protein [Portunus trituberculatus]